MRHLLYVPIVHSRADIGLAGMALEQTSTAIVGLRRWRLHEETVSRFWDSVGSYLCSLDARRLKIYQDGLPADGEVGRRVVEEAARRGSQNYQLVLNLLSRGAELRKTEDPVLLWQERQDLLEQVQQQAVGLRDIERYRQRRDQLIEARDSSIARAINTTLKVGETGLLFIGAYHNVASHLDGDLSVEFLRDPSLVRAYFQALFLGQDDRGLAELAQSLVGAAHTHGPTVP